MVLWGSIVNALVIVAGALLGRLVKFPKQLQHTTTNALGLTVLIIGISMGLETGQVLIPISALVIGSVVGELLMIENKIARLGQALERRFHREKGESTNDFTQGFLTATLIFCVGAMAVIGGLNSGLRGDHQVLYAKSALDGVMTVFLSASFGIGAGFSALPVLLYQGGIALLATFVSPLLSTAVLQEISATGGMLIVGIGLNMLGLTQIAVGNMLPAIFFALTIAHFFT